MTFTASLRREREQRDDARAFDGSRQRALMFRAGAGDPARHDLAAFGHELAQLERVFVVDRVDLVDAELTDLTLGLALDAVLLLWLLHSRRHLEWDLFFGFGVVFVFWKIGRRRSRRL